jgi:hypothetical protein
MVVQSFGALSNACPRTVHSVAPAGRTDIAVSIIFALKNNRFSGTILCFSPSCGNPFASCGSESDGTISNVFVDLIESMDWTEVVTLTSIWMCHFTTLLFVIHREDVHEEGTSFDTSTTDLRCTSHLLKQHKKKSAVTGMTISLGIKNNRSVRLQVVGSDSATVKAVNNIVNIMK